MTIEEAIDVLETLQAQMDYSEYDALDMAIEALEQKTCEGCRYERNAGFEEECHYCDRWGSDRYVKREEEAGEDD